MCAHYIFYNFSQVIFYYMPKRFFSYCIFALQINFIFPICVCVLSKIKISHSNICLYIIAARLRIGVAARIDYGHILSMVDLNSAEIGSDGATWLWFNPCSQLVCLILYKQIANRQLHIILRWKNVWMYTNLPCKNVMSEWIFIWKMWMVLTLILI